MKGGKYKAAICGGISMGVLGTNELDIKLDFDDVRFRGGCLGLGTAGMIIMNEHTSMVEALRNCVRFYAHESCGQCTPCREGMGWVKRMMDRMVIGDAEVDEIDVLDNVTRRIEGHTICALADGGVWPVQGLIRHFRPLMEDRIAAYKARTTRLAAE
jgi:NADH-quinone oxidoreductase subunit F